MPETPSNNDAGDFRTENNATSKEPLIRASSVLAKDRGRTFPSSDTAGGPGSRRFTAVDIYDEALLDELGGGVI